MQNQLKAEMKVWLEEYCRKDEKMEEQLREILLQNKYFVRNLHQLFIQKNSRAMKNQIEDYVRLKINKVICDHCEKVNMVLKTSLENSACYN